MAFDGNGNYIRIHNWTQDAANGLDINAGEMDAEDNSIQGAFNITVTRDGQGKMAADFVPVSGGLYNLGTAGLPWLNITAKSGTIGPPASGTAWTVNGVAGNYSVSAIGSSTTGQSRGLLSAAGTNTSDFCAVFQNQAQTINYALVWGDGSVTVGNAPTGLSQGIGTINVASGYFINGNPVYSGIPQNHQSGAAYTLVLADANKHIYKDTNTNGIVIPANASVAFPIGTAVTIVNDGNGSIPITITTDTLVWSPPGTTGARTLALFGLATLLKVTATRWYISGTGLT